MSGSAVTDDQIELAWLPRRLVAIYPSHTMRRISTQKSCFTIHRTELNAMHDLAKNEAHRRATRAAVSSHVEAIALTMCAPSGCARRRDEASLVSTAIPSIVRQKRG
jgi:hypothetical protein